METERAARCVHTPTSNSIQLQQTRVQFYFLFCSKTDLTVYREIIDPHIDWFTLNLTITVRLSLTQAGFVQENNF